jgi:hypothetical protein
LRCVVAGGAKVVPRAAEAQEDRMAQDKPQGGRQGTQQGGGQQGDQQDTQQGGQQGTRQGYPPMEGQPGR